MRKRVETLDVREDIRQGREPFARIMAAVSRLGPEDDLLLLAPFGPVPLYGVLGQQGFSYSSEATAEGDFRVLFSRGLAERDEGCGDALQTKPAQSSRSCAGRPVVNVDARGLEPPEPLVKILEALAALPEGADLRAHTDRRPMHLYATLEERGFVADTQEQKDGSFVTHVRRG